MLSKRIRTTPVRRAKERRLRYGIRFRRFAGRNKGEKRDRLRSCSIELRHGFCLLRYASSKSRRKEPRLRYGPARRQDGGRRRATDRRDYAPPKEENVSERLSVAEILAHLEKQMAFHQQQKALHTEQEVFHREQA